MAYVPRRVRTVKVRPGLDPEPEGGDSLAVLGAASTGYQTAAETIDNVSIWRQARRAAILISRLAADKLQAAARDRPMP